jgi:DNA-binding XRE family transcriptional regulator
MGNFNQQLIEARHNRNLTQQELAQLVNINIDTVKMIEEGSYDPTLSEMDSIADVLNWSFKIGNVMI